MIVSATRSSETSGEQLLVQPQDTIVSSTNLLQISSLNILQIMCAKIDAESWLSVEIVLPAKCRKNAFIVNVSCERMLLSGMYRVKECFYHECIV